MVTAARLNRLINALLLSSAFFISGILTVIMLSDQALEEAASKWYRFTVIH